MAAYGALVSLMNTINDIQHHPHPPISLDQHQIESLTEAANFFKDFLGTYNPHASYTEEADPLEIRIAAASYAAEDAIEFSIVDHILPDGDVAAGSVDLYEDLQRVIGDMDSIKKEVMEIKQRKGVQHHQILQLQSHSTTVGSASRSSSIQQNTAMVGIEKVSYELLDKLIGGNPCRQVIPVTGMGGIGKTTLATNVYQHQIVVEHFEIRSWATISQDFMMKETLLKLHQPLLKLHQDKLSEMNEYELRLKLHQILSGRRYLIVLDDIWDIEVWNKLQLYFPDNNNGSRIVLTTRLSKLAHEVCGYESPSLGIEMRFLDEDTSWDLFCKVVFGREDCPLELETIGRKIVASCKGLPLSINVIGGLLAMSVQTRQYWEYVVENLSSIVNSEENEHCLKILYTSYNSLPVYLKPCFMYMGVFKEDSDICVAHLIQLWVAEGFVEAVSGKSLEEVAEERLTELVDRNLILVEKLDSLGNLKWCKIHDLLRDLCLREARKHKFLNIVGAHGFDIPQDLSGERRICIYEMKKWMNRWCALESSSVERSIQRQKNTMYDLVNANRFSYELLDKLIGGNPCLHVISVTGMGGIGKTTLAANVYQHQIVVDHFDICVWATISQEFRMKETLLGLHQDLRASEMNEYELGEKLHQKLSGRRYLIVLDDVWDIKVWDELQLYFPDNNNGSRVVLTTRLSKLAHEACGYESPSIGIAMRFLDKDTTWVLLLLWTCSTYFNGKYDLDFVCRRVNLRFLCARGTAHVDSFLSSISNLWNLQTLIVHPLSWSTPPSEIWNMSRLRHIEFRPTIELPDPPLTDDVFVLENLQTLSRVKNMKFGDEVVQRIPNIKKLKVVYEGVEEGLHGYCLNNLSHLRALGSLSLKVYMRGFSEMQNMTFPQSLKKLRLRGTYLQWEDMTKMLGSLPLLQVLRLGSDACQGAEWHTTEGQFCNLKFLEIKCCDLEYWETDSSHFPRLEHLLLTGLWNLNEVPSSIGDISTLQSIGLDRCRNSAYDSAKSIREEQVGQGNEGLQVRFAEEEEKEGHNI